MMQAVEIAMLPSNMSHKVAVMAHISNMVNCVYGASEKSLWAQETARTTSDEIASFTDAEELAVAQSMGEIVGCVRVRRIGQETGDFGMLAVSHQYQGGGIGGELIRFAEQKCLKEGLRTMQLELLVPRAGSHPTKIRLKDWYIRLGYVPVGTENIDTAFPKLTSMLAIPCIFIVFQKKLC